MPGFKLTRQGATLSITAANSYRGKMTNRRKHREMKQFLERWARKTAIWMQGRYGNDDFSNGLVALGVICMIVSLFPNCGWLSWVALAAFAVVLWRTCSKNIARRRAENQKYLQVTAKPRRAYELAKKKFTNRKTTKYFRCKNCGQELSVPKGKGTLRVVCPKCKTETKMKS